MSAASPSLPAPASRRPSGEPLAIFGGVPAFPEPLHVGRPNVGDRDRLLARIGDMLDRRWLTNHGPYVRELEQRIADHLGVAHCIATTNATIGLEIAIRALDLTGEVIVPSYTFVATAHALQWQQITPVFADIRGDTHTIDPERIEALITPRTTGIIGVHLWGRVCDVDALAEIAGRRRLRLLYDAAHAFGASYRGRMAGSFGDAEVLSFHATKFLNSFEGGAIVTNDGELAKRVRLMTNFGFAGFDHVVHIGTNGKMSEVAAAMGLTSLESLDEFVETNRANHGTYGELLRGIPGLRLLPYDANERGNYQYVVVEVDEAEAGIGRDDLVRVLNAENVIARRYFWPGCHRMEPYASLYPHWRFLLPVTEQVAGRVMVLPTGTAVGPEEIGLICGILRMAVENGRECAARLAPTV